MTEQTISLDKVLTKEQITAIKQSGIDFDGDIITVNGADYYIDVFNNTAKKILK